MRFGNRSFTVCGLLLTTCAFGAGCETASHAPGDALFGGGLGALTGAVIGSMTGHRNGAAAGALIGAAAGAAGGAMVGHAQDASEPRDAAIAQAHYDRQVLAAERAALTNADIVYMTKNGLSEQLIISSIRSRGGIFDTTPDAIIQLKADGVNDFVIQAMQRTPPPSAAVAGPGPAYVVQPGPYYASGVVVAPPGPAVGVYVRPRPYYYGYYGGGWRRW